MASNLRPPRTYPIHVCISRDGHARLAARNFCDRGIIDLHFTLCTAVLIFSSVLHLEQFRRNFRETFLSSSLIKYERTSHNIFHHWLPLLHASQGQDAKTWHRIHRYQLGQLSRAKGRSEGKIRKKYRTTNIL